MGASGGVRAFSLKPIVIAVYRNDQKAPSRTRAISTPRSSSAVRKRILGGLACARWWLRPATSAEMTVNVHVSFASVERFRLTQKSRLTCACERSSGRRLSSAATGEGVDGARLSRAGAEGQG